MFSSVCNIREKRRDVLQITIYMLGKFRSLLLWEIFTNLFESAK